MTPRTEERIETCIGCDSYDRVSRMCARCGCFMPIKWRIGVATCPDDKWKE
jgi:hypothetical protein